MSSRPLYRMRAGGAIWWMLTRWRPGLLDWTVSNLAPFVSGCLLPVLKLVVVAVLRDKLLFNPCKAERHVLTVINEDYDLVRNYYLRKTRSSHLFILVFTLWSHLPTSLTPSTSAFFSFTFSFQMMPKAFSETCNFSPQVFFICMSRPMTEKWPQLRTVNHYWRNDWFEYSFTFINRLMFLIYFSVVQRLLMLCRFSPDILYHSLIMIAWLIGYCVPQDPLLLK